MGSHRLHPVMQWLGRIASCQMERRKRSYFKKWCICQDHSISSHGLRWWTRMIKSNWWITMVSTSTISLVSWLPLHLRSMGDSFWSGFWIELRNGLNTPISTTTAACWHLSRLRMHLGMMQRSGCYRTTAWHTSVWRLRRSCWGSSAKLQLWLGSAIARAESSANQLESPLLRMQLPVTLSLCSSCTQTYVVPWKRPCKDLKICCSSSTTPRGIRMSTYSSTSQKP